MQLVNFVSVLSLMTASSSAFPQFKRAITTDTILYAYGTNISGLPILYGNADGLAYIAANASSAYSSLTWDIDSTGAETWNGTFTSGTHNTTTTGSFFITDDGSSFEPAGFVTPNTTTTDTDRTTAGFATYGGQVVFIADDQYESQFWAQTTDVDGVWALKWNSDGSSQSDSVPVTVKTTAPTVLS